MTEKGNGPVLGFVFGSLGAFSFSLLNLLIHIGEGQYQPQVLAAVRGAFGTVVLFPFVFRTVPLLFSRDAKFVWLRTLAGSAGMLCVFWSLQHAALGDATALSNLSPLFVAFFSFKFFHEKLSRRELFGILCVVVGALSLKLPGGSGVPALVFAVGALGSFCGSFAFLALKQATKIFSPLLVVWAFHFMATVSSIAASHGGWEQVTRKALWYFLAIGLTGVLGQIFMTLSYTYQKAAIANALNLTSLIWGVIYDMAIFDRIVSVLSFTSYTLILGGVYILQTRKVTFVPPGVSGEVAQ